MLNENEILMIQKATIYDLQKILESGGKEKTYTIAEIKELMDAYMKGAAQLTERF